MRLTATVTAATPPRPHRTVRYGSSHPKLPSSFTKRHSPTYSSTRHARPRRQLERLAHQRHHVRLRDRLPLADGQRRVLVGALGQPGLDEEMARHLPHGREHRRVAEAPRLELLGDHAVAGLLEV